MYRITTGITDVLTLKASCLLFTLPRSTNACPSDRSSPAFSCVRSVHAGLRSGGTSLSSRPRRLMFFVFGHADVSTFRRSESSHRVGPGLFTLSEAEGQSGLLPFFTSLSLHSDPRPSAPPSQTPLPNTSTCHSEPAAFWRVKRSEERRVGKECRSRWSPYH